MYEAIEYVGTDPDLLDLISFSEKFYIPKYTDKTDRNQFLSYVGSFGKTDKLRQMNLFKMDTEKYAIDFHIREDTTAIYPTKGLVPSEEMQIYLYSRGGGDTACITLDGRSRFSMADKFHLIANHNSYGRYEYQGEDLILIIAASYSPYKCYRYYFAKVDDGYRYVAKKSNPYPNRIIPDGTVYSYTEG